MRSKKLITELHHLGVSVSYGRVMQIENDIAHSVCNRTCSYSSNTTACFASILCCSSSSSFVAQKHDYKPLTWASYRAHLHPPMTVTPSISAMLPLSSGKADSPAMIKHVMDILKEVASFRLHPGQIPVIACDCTIFAEAKFIQSTWPATYEEDIFLAIFGRCPSVLQFQKLQ